MASGWGRGYKGQVGPSLDKSSREPSEEQPWADAGDRNLNTVQ